MKDLTCRERIISELRRYPYDVMAMQQLSMELETAEEEIIAIKATNYDKMPGGSGANVQEEKIIDAIANKQEKEARLKATRLRVRDIESLLAWLNSQERDIIQQMVISNDNNAAEKIAAKIGVEKRQVFNQKNQIIHHLCMIKYGQGYQP